MTSAPVPGILLEVGQLHQTQSSLLLQSLGDGGVLHHSAEPTTPVANRKNLRTASNSTALVLVHQILPIFSLRVEERQRTRRVSLTSHRVHTVHRTRNVEGAPLLPPRDFGRWGRFLVEKEPFGNGRRMKNNKKIKRHFSKSLFHELRPELFEAIRRRAVALADNLHSSLRKRIRVPQRICKGDSTIGKSNKRALQAWWRV